MARLDEIDIINAATQDKVTLKRATSPEFTEVYDVDSFRAPFGITWHQVGTGHQLPSTIRIHGVLDGGSLAASDDLLQALQELLPYATRLRLGGWQVPIAGGTGPLAALPIRTGWSVEFTVVLGTGAWTWGNTMTADSTVLTADSTAYTADYVGPIT